MGRHPHKLRLQTPDATPFPSPIPPPLVQTGGGGSPLVEVAVHFPVQRTSSLGATVSASLCVFRGFGSGEGVGGGGVGGAC